MKNKKSEMFFDCLNGFEFGWRECYFTQYEIVKESLFMPCNITAPLFISNTTAVDNVWRKGDGNDVSYDVEIQDQGHTLLYSLQQSKCLA